MSRRSVGVEKVGVEKVGVEEVGVDRILLLSPLLRPLCKGKRNRSFCM